MKIKHFFSLAALMALAMTACTADEVVSTPQTAETPITFKAYTGNMTRALHSYGSNGELPTQFTLWAFKGTENYFAPKQDDGYSYMPGGSYYSGDVISNTSGTWTNTTATRYWPKSGSKKLNFYAYLDSHGVNLAHELDSNEALQNKIKNYEVNSAQADQYDFMYAVAYQAEPDNSNSVTLTFQHALCQICFTGQNDDSGTDIKISTIEVCNIYNKGDFYFPNVNSTDNLNCTWDFQNVSVVQNINASFEARFNTNASDYCAGIVLPKAVLTNVEARMYIKGRKLI